MRQQKFFVQMSVLLYNFWCAKVLLKSVKLSLSIRSISLLVTNKLETKTILYTSVSMCSPTIYIRPNRVAFLVLLIDTGIYKFSKMCVGFLFCCTTLKVLFCSKWFVSAIGGTLLGYINCVFVLFLNWVLLRWMVNCGSRM